MPEAERLEDNRNAYRVSRLKDKKVIFQLARFPDPSDSPESPARITIGDMLRVAGLLSTNDLQKERLIGLKLLPDPEAQAA